MPSRCLLFLLPWFFALFPLIGSNLTPGYKFLRNYTSREYDHQPQNWSIVQDRRGVIFVANQAGLLEFDGLSWRVIDVPNHLVRSIALDEAGRLYTGGKEEFGYFFTPSRTNPNTSLYTSVSNDLNAQDKPVSTVMRVHKTGHGIYFRTSNMLYRWQPGNGQMNTWKPANRFHTSFVCGDRFYVNQPGTGLMVVAGDSLELAEGGQFFAHKKIYMMTPYEINGDEPSGKVLIGTRAFGLFLYDGGSIVPFKTGADDYLRRHRLYHGIRLRRSPGQFALATLDGGLLIIDKNGQLNQIYDKSSGLQDNRVYYVYEDRQGNLWLALNNGISKIEYHSPFSIIDQRLGLKGFVLSAAEFGWNKSLRRLYAGTDKGLFYYVPGPQGRFQSVPGIPGYCWSLLSTEKLLLAATTGGAYAIEKNNSGHTVTRLSREPCFVLTASERDSNRIWCGAREGLRALYYTGDTWKHEKKIPGIQESITSIATDPEGRLWLSAGNGGVLSLSFPLNGSIDNPGITRYTAGHGLPGGETAVYRIAGHIMLASEKGLYKYHAGTDRFVPDETLGKRFAGGGGGVFRLAQDMDNLIWFHSRSLNYRAVPLPDNTFSIDGIPFRRLSLEQVNAIYPGKNGKLIWFARHDGLYGFDKTVEKNYRLPFRTLIREVYVDGLATFFNEEEFRYKKTDGNETNKDEKDSRKKAESFAAEIPYEKRNLRFRFAAPFFENESATRFSFLLEGYDKKWSPWTAETRKDYTNLDPGFHRFRVRARNVYGHISREAVYEFKLLPPWYRTWWAYSFYVLCVLLLFYGGVKWRSARLEKEKSRLETLVRDRTREVRDKNRQLQEMAHVKSRFFANISHEFRTPLTLIMGPLEEMSGKPFDAMLHNTHRLLNLIDQLLELSKIESGKMKLKAAPQDAVPFLKGILSSFEMEAEQRDVKLIFSGQPGEIPFYFDVDILDKIICNLLSNALKFTPGGGSVTLSASLTEGEIQGQGQVVLSVQDTGPGIPADQLPHIFDRFYQAGHTQTFEGKQKGSGIGLALVKELVTLHHGRIEAFSGGSGSRFTLWLPLGRDHFAEGEVIDMPETYPQPRPTAGIRQSPAHMEEEEISPGRDGEAVILVVEDNAEMRHYIAQSLQDSFTIIQAADGKQGVQKARETIPDLIISDIMMPHVDGYQLCATLKKEVTTSHIPIILLTAKASDENIIRGLETGSDDYITKPFNAKILNSRVKNLIDLRRDLQERIRRDMLLQPSEINVSSVDEIFLKELREVIEQNLPDSEFNVEALAGKLYMSRATLYRKIMALTGQSPNHFIRSYRLKRAAQLLRNHFGNVTEVAMEVGFSNMAHFAKCFKDAFHQLPSTYQSSGSSG